MVQKKKNALNHPFLRVHACMFQLIPKHTQSGVFIGTVKITHISKFLHILRQTALALKTLHIKAKIRKKQITLKNTEPMSQVKEKTQRKKKKKSLAPRPHSVIFCHIYISLKCSSSIWKQMVFNISSNAIYCIGASLKIPLLMYSKN